jgi:hypothetical protein
MVNYNSFKEQTTVILIVNCDRNMSIVQATGYVLLA